MKLGQVRRVGLHWLLAVALIAIPAPVAAQGTDLREVFESAIAAYDDGRYELAISAFTTVIENAATLTESSLSNVHWRRGTAYRGTGADERALADFTRAIELAPDLAIAYHSRGLTQRSLGDERAADRRFRSGDCAAG